MEERKIVGYNLTETQYKNTVLKLLVEGEQLGRELGFEVDVQKQSNIDKFNELGLLDKWFEPVYEKWYITTEDGVKIYDEMQVIYGVLKVKTAIGYAIQETLPLWLREGFIYFSTKEKRQEWISEQTNKEKLFLTTVDGVKVYEGDEVWCFNFNKLVLVTLDDNTRQFKVFSTKEAAENYLLKEKCIEKLKKLKEEENIEIYRIGDWLINRNGLIFKLEIDDCKGFTKFSSLFHNKATTNEILDHLGEAFSKLYDGEIKVTYNSEYFTVSDEKGKIIYRTF